MCLTPAIGASAMDFSQLQRFQIAAPLNRHHAAFYSKTIRVKGGLNAVARSQNGKMSMTVDTVKAVKAHVT